MCDKISDLLHYFAVIHLQEVSLWFISEIELRSLLDETGEASKN